MTPTSTRGAARVWKLESSTTHQSGNVGGSSSSSSGNPMLPASAVRRPSARRKCAISALTVLLPFVPVTAITRACGCSANHSAVPDVNSVPLCCASRISGRYALMPGDLMTTSNALSAAASGGVVIGSPRHHRL